MYWARWTAVTNPMDALAQTPTATGPAGGSQITQPLVGPPIMGPEGYQFFISTESAFVEAAVARLIPNDGLGPGGLEAGCSFFIDHQLAGDYGLFARHYTVGPWATDAPPLWGYQLQFLPREIYQIGIRGTNDYCQKQYENTFDQLTGQQQDEVLSALEQGQVNLGDLPSTVFFAFLHDDTVWGFFSDPMYGGNANKVGWLLTGYPAANVDQYPDLVGKTDTNLGLPPMSIAEMQQAMAQPAPAGMPGAGAAPTAVTSGPVTLTPSAPISGTATLTTTLPITATPASSK